MKIDDTNYTDKASKDPEQRKIYEESDDYIDAYSRHTDWRIKNSGPAQAIGGDWETHGKLQLSFLQKRGLTKESTILDFGCGTGRFARIAVPFLNSGNYTGIDISAGAIEHCMVLGTNEGWLTQKKPIFIHGKGTLDGFRGERFDFIWAHSIVNHCPPEINQANFKAISDIDFDYFYFTYKKRDTVVRTGLKQFGYTPEWLMEQAAKVGMKCEPLPDRWPQGQSCAVITKA